MNSKLSKQRGVMLLEALIAILIFSIGILAIVGMQAVSVSNVAEAKYRADASFLANEVVGLIWTDRAHITNFDYAGVGAPPAAIAVWVAKVQNQMPGADLSPPQIDVVHNGHVAIGSTDYNSYTVSVSIRWQSPQEAHLSPAPPPHSYTTTAYFEYCPPPGGPGSIPMC